MSLINDALKRAKEAQQQAPSPATHNLEFKPVEPVQHSRSTPGLLVPAIVICVGLLIGTIVWASLKRSTPANEAKPQAAVMSPSAAPAPNASRARESTATESTARAIPTSQASVADHSQNNLPSLPQSARGADSETRSPGLATNTDRKSTRLNSSHVSE